MRHMPNVLSLLRILFAICLPFARTDGAFIVLYILCGLSDVLDGWLARRFGWMTALGSKLDSLGDLVFWAVVLGLLYLRSHIFTLAFTVGLALIVALRAANALITKKRFGQWGMLHSYGNKISGLLLYLLLPLAVLRGELPLWAIMVLFLSALLSAAEECILLLTMDAYDSDRKSLFF